MKITAFLVVLIAATAYSVPLLGNVFHRISGAVGSVHKGTEAILEDLDHTLVGVVENIAGIPKLVTKKQTLKKQSEEEKKLQKKENSKSGTEDSVAEQVENKRKSTEKKPNPGDVLKKIDSVGKGVVKNVRGDAKRVAEGAHTAVESVGKGVAIGVEGVAEGAHTAVESVDKGVHTAIEGVAKGVAKGVNKPASAESDAEEAKGKLKTMEDESTRETSDSMPETEECEA